MGSQQVTPAFDLTKFPRINLFSLEMITGSFEALILDLIRIASGPKKVITNQPISLMVVSMQDLMANLFNSKVAAAIHTFNYLTLDGMPLVWLAKILGFSADRMYGPDIFKSILEKSANLPVRHFFYGGSPDLLKKLEKNLTKKWPKLKVAGFLAPPFRAFSLNEKNLFIQQINQSQPDIVWVGLGSWKQLLWTAEFKSVLKTKLIIPVGMAFDLLAGEKNQAPDWVRRNGWEWLFRLINEPVRLWSRYLWQVPFFGIWWLLELIYQWQKINAHRK